jgi:hypothetical protein
VKYFTLDWWRGAQDLEPVEDQFEKYNNYYRSIKGNLPQSIIDIHEKIFLHDSELRSIVMDAEQIKLTLKLIARIDGNLKEVTLEYSGVISFGSISLPEKAFLARVVMVIGGILRLRLLMVS